MLDDLGNKHPVLDVALKLLGDRALLGVIIGTFLGRKVDVNGRRLAGEDLGGKALLAQIDGSAINLVQKNGRNDTVDLQSELGRLDDVQAAHQGINNDGKTGAVVDGNSIRLAGNLDDRLVDARDEDRLVLLRRNLDNILCAVEVLHQPLATLQFLARRLASTHALGLGLLVWRG